MTNIYIYAYTYIHDSTLGLGCAFRDRKSIPDRRLRFTLGLKLRNLEGAVNGWFTWFCVYGFITHDGSMGRTAKKCLHENHQNQRKVGKYTIHGMDPMRTKGRNCKVSSSIGLNSLIGSPWESNCRGKSFKLSGW